MAKVEYQGKLVDVVEDWRVGELIEAENALNIDMDGAKGGARAALVVYISVRRVDARTPAGALADAVLKMELASVISDDKEADRSPPAEGVEDDPDSETDEPQTVGPLRSVNSA